MKLQPNVVIDTEFAQKVSGSFYDRYYICLDSNSTRWRDFGAIEKCKSIIYLCKDLKPNTVVDFGCGTCSIIKLLDRKKFAKDFYGLEISPSVVRFIQENIKIPHLRTIFLVDTENTDFEDAHFDLGILSHVVEHVSNPCGLIKEALRICKFVVVEVPLDLNLFTILYNKLTNRHQLNNTSGHIQFFTKNSFRNVIQESGGIIINDRLYRQLSIFHTDFSWRIIIKYLRSTLFFILVKITGSYLVGSHYAVLIRKS